MFLKFTGTYTAVRNEALNNIFQNTFLNMGILKRCPPTKDKIFNLVGLVTFLMMFGCGKKTITDNDNSEVSRSPQTPSDRYLDKQSVTCEPGQGCPNYIAKVVIKHGPVPTFCTGFLTDENTIATNASCLPELLRLNGQNCGKDIFFLFPETPNLEAIKVGCRKVTLTSQLEGDDPNLWRDDVVFLELSKPVLGRKQVSINRSGILDKKEYTTWMIDQLDDFSAIIKKSQCEGLHNSFINPLVTNDSSPGMLFSDCLFSRGASGAPVIDKRGNAVGIISKKMDSKLRSYLESTGLLTESLKDIVHASNFACAPTPYDGNMRDEGECLKDLSYKKIDRMRSDMLSSNGLFGEMKKKYESSIQDVSKYIRIGVKLISNGDEQDMIFFPRCFKPIETWIYNIPTSRNAYLTQVELPVKKFKRSMNGRGKIFASTIDAGTKTLNFQFSLKNLRNFGRTNILMWSSDDIENIETFRNINDNCLLF